MTAIDDDDVVVTASRRRRRSSSRSSSSSKALGPESVVKEKIGQIQSNKYDHYEVKALIRTAGFDDPVITP